MKVLVAPLDWGLGHATRCIPIIQEFLNGGAQVELATSGPMISLYQEVFPNLVQHRVPSYKVVYPKLGFTMPLWVLKNAVRFSKMFKMEQALAERMADKHQYDLIVSDNRFGFYSKKVKSIYVTHQLRIAFPKGFQIFEMIGVYWHLSYMKRYTEVWIPDFQKAPGMAGRLSHVSKMPERYRYVGVLTRFQEEIQELKKEVRFLGIVSGVEPMRTQFEKKLRNVFSKLPGNHVLILGKPKQKNTNQESLAYQVYPHLSTPDFKEMVQKSEYVITRSGYSTVMDMSVLGAKCVFVPTPGQTEQEYLGESLEHLGHVVISDLLFNSYTLKLSLEKAKKLEINFSENASLLKDAVHHILKEV